jgi:hypothetical protein
MPKFISAEVENYTPKQKPDDQQNFLYEFGDSSVQSEAIKRASN